jgi:protein ImuB
VFALVVCVLLPRFELAVAVGDRRTLLRGPAALAPAPGDGNQAIGEPSAAAEAFGVRTGMRLGEALARCPRLALVPPDPAGVAEAWELVLARLEGIGAAVAPERPGLVCFEELGLRRLLGGGERVIAAARRAVGRSEARVGAGPSRFCALAAASRARPRRPEVVAGDAAAARAYLAPLPVELLCTAGVDPELPATLERLGVGTLGALAALPRAAIADRFGEPGLQALDLVRGAGGPPRPRAAGERVGETLELPEAASGPQLEHALGLLVDRMLARRERRGRTLRAAALAARLVEGGTWRERIAFRESTADPRRLRLALAPHLAELPAPARTLELVVERFGPPVSDQRPLLDEAAAARDARLREAVAQARAAAGPDAALRVIDIDPDSRVPERRSLLAPYDGAPPARRQSGRGGRP